MNGTAPSKQGPRATLTNNPSKDPNLPSRNGCASNEDVHLMLDNLARFIFGSCVSAVEAASDLVPDSWQKGANCQPVPRKQRHADPRLAGLAGRYESKSINPPENFGGFPSFLEGESVDCSLGEEHSAFDDNISALSAFTLEEMARMNATPRYPSQRAKPTFKTVPPVARISSSSSSSRDNPKPTRYKFSSKKGLSTLQEFRGPRGRKKRGKSKR